VLGELLGRGGMAEVFSGYVIGSHGFQKPVAIKRLLPDLANDEVFVDRLIGEAKLLVGMQHGNIVSVLDLARDGDDVFLVMEYVDGPSLRQLIKGRGSRRLPLGTATYIVQAAAAGLEFAHARPGGAIIHADISPSNLLLTTSGEVRVADFGIARREGGGAGVVEGKWAYMAPEQARGEPLTPRCDVFALGVVLYELITGQHPLGQRITADERDSGRIRIVPPRVVDPSVPPGLDAICMKALAEQARDRYARMQHLIDAIIDERFANQWREGASDLAQAIREIMPGGVASTGPRTQVTDRPVTIMTRSLISQSQRTEPPVTVPSEDSIETQEAISHSMSAAPTSLIELPSTPVIPAAMLMPALPVPELASVHGGATVTGASSIDVRDTRTNRWAYSVLGVAAVIGVIAAIAIQLAPAPEVAPVEEHHVAMTATPIEAAPPPAPAPLAVAPAPQPTVPSAPPPAPRETAPIATAPVDTASTSEPAESDASDAAEDHEPARTRVRKARTAPAAKRAAAADATLRVNTYDGTWAQVAVAGQRQYAPGAKFKLVPGRYTVRLKNPDLGLSRSCAIHIDSGEVMTLKVALEEGACEVSKY
jgi:serine/threonine-protein kinase